MNRRSIVFISCSLEDEPFARDVCARLEETGIRCWFAPRDIVPGAQYAEQVVQAITDASTVVVILSATTESSQKVSREIAFAVAKGIRVVLCRIDGETTTPDRKGRFYLAAPPQIFDARTGTEDFSRLVDMLSPHDFAAPSPSAPSVGHPAFSAPPPVGPDGRGSFPQAEKVLRDPVDCSVYAPPTIVIDDDIFIQVYAHIPGQGEQVRRMAQEFDSETQRRGVTSLGTEIPRGAILNFRLSIPKLSIGTPVQQLTWQGNPQYVQFTAHADLNTPPGTVIGSIDVSQDTVPIGILRFKLTVARRLPIDKAQPKPCGESRRYNMAFISYASSDRFEVLKRVQMLSSVGIRYFQDVLDLDPGDRWTQELFRYIDESDVMFLFWSSSARSSQWVRREWKYGLETKGDDFIRPVVIEGPPPPEPPEELKHLHFADKIMYFIRNEE